LKCEMSIGPARKKGI